MSGWDVVVAAADQPSLMPLRPERALCCAVPDAAPGDVGGGGGSRSELVITWEVIHPSNVGVSFFKPINPLHFHLGGSVPPQDRSRRRRSHRLPARLLFSGLI